MANDRTEMNPSTPAQAADAIEPVLGLGPALVLVVTPGDAAEASARIIARHQAQGDAVTLVALGDAPPRRGKTKRSSATAAVSTQATPAVESWGESLDALRYGEALVTRLLSRIESQRVKVVHAPDVTETEPHRVVLGLAAREAVRRASAGCVLMTYRTRPQSSSVPRHASAIPEPELSRVETAELSRPIPGLTDQLSTWPLAVSDEPLVTVVIRSAGRWTLGEALDSIAAQTHRAIEVVVADVEGRGRLDLGDRCGSFPLRVVSKGVPLGRGAAANVGLDASRGVYVVFLDDDDWYLPDHVAALVEAVRATPGLGAAYAGVECRTLDDAGQWTVLNVFNERHDPTQLMLQNYLPMHAVLFERARVGPELRFDETLEFYEDWDFWVQLSLQTDFAHVDRITAIYRISAANAFGLPQDEAEIVRGMRPFFEKWRQRWTTDQAVAIARYAIRGAAARGASPSLHEIGSTLHGLAAGIGQQTDLLGRFEASLARIESIMDQSSIHWGEAKTRWQAERALVESLGGAMRETQTKLLESHTRSEALEQALREARSTLEAQRTQVASFQQRLQDERTRAETLDQALRDERRRVATLDQGLLDERARVSALQSRLHDSEACVEALEEARRQAETDRDIAARRADAERVELEARLLAAEHDKAMERRHVETLRVQLEAVQAARVAAETEQRAEHERAEILDQVAARLRQVQTSLETRLAAAVDLAKSYGARREKDFFRLYELQLGAAWPIAIRLLRIDARFPGLSRRSIGLMKVLWWILTFQLPSALRRRRRVKRIVEAGLFDELWYIQKNPEVLFDGYRPLNHWLSLGWKEGRNPHPLFDIAWYLECNPRVAQTGANPLLHYLDEGAAAGLDPHPLFDSDWYLEHNPDVADAGENPLSHFIQQGAREGRDPHPLFDVRWYLEQNPDVVGLGINPLVHYVEHGIREGRAGHPTQVPADGVALEAAVANLEPNQQDGPDVTTEMATALAESPRPAQLASFVLTPPVTDIRMNLETIAGPSCRASDAMAVRGWLVARGGVERAHILIDGTEQARIERLIERPDVLAAHRDVADTLKSGFDMRLDLSGIEPGEHDMAVVVSSRLGVEHRHHVRLIVEEPRERWHLAFHRHQPSRAERAAMAEALETWPRRPRLAALIACRLGFPERLLGDLAAQVMPPTRVVLMPGQDRGTAAELAWKIPVWRELHAKASFSIEVLDPDEVIDALPVSVDAVVLLDAGDRLTRDALFHLARETLDGRVDLVYCDHDEISDDGLHVAPHLKPAWSPSLLLHRDYIGGCLLVDRERLDARALACYQRPAWRYLQALIGPREGFEVRHVERVLWSRRADRGDELAHARELAASWSTELEPGARVLLDPETGDRRILWPLPEPRPLVSIVIPTTGKPTYLIPCLTSILERTTYTDYELIILDNGRGKFPEGIDWVREHGLTILECDEPFNWSRLNNRGALAAKGEYLLFLNDDIEITDPDWLSWLVAHATRPGIGCVGALLHYPSGEIQHDGVFLVDHGGGARHWFHRLEPSPRLYQRLDRVTREVSAVTGACLMVRTDLFETLGGFDEAFVVTHNDVDFCLRVAARGLRNLVVADTSLIHHESVHRGDTSSPEDDRRMWMLWETRLRECDRYHHRGLIKDSAQCEVDYNQSSSTTAECETSNGLNCIAYVTAEMGLGEAARGILASLERAEIEVDAIDYLRGNPARCEDRRWIHRLVQPGEARYATSLYIINADWLPTVKADVCPQVPNERYAIGYWAWELAEFPRRWEGSFDLVDEIWVASEHVRGGVQRLTEKPVRVVPNPVELDAIDLPGHEVLGLRPGAFTFLTLFDVHSIVARKNPMGAIEAFMKAFEPDDQQVRLVIKLNNADEETLDRLALVTKGWRNVTILDRVLTRHEINGLLASCDVLVSLHRAEGFGLPPAEAMWLGKPVVATGYSGNLDFMTETNSILIPYELVRIGDGQGPYDRDRLWAEPDLDAAADAMQRLSRDPALCESLGRAAWRDVRERLSPDFVGPRLKQILSQAAAAS